MLTPAQKTALRANINATPEALALDGNLTGLADYYNAAASPAFWVWRTNVSRADIYTQQNDLPINPPQTGFWSWTTYKNQNITEQNAWVQMFMQDVTNFAAQNVRDGINSIFTGTGAPQAQREHCLAIGRRVEKLFATGTGSTASPALMVFEGPLTTNDLIGV